VVAVRNGIESASETLIVETLAPPLSEAVLDGGYRVTYSVLSSNLGNVQAGDRRHFTWEFDAECTVGPCGGSWTIQVEYGPAVGSFAPDGTGSLAGSMAGVSLGECQGIVGVDDFAITNVLVTEARIVDGVWTATVFEGTYREDFPAGNGCSAGFLEASVLARPGGVGV